MTLVPGGRHELLERAGSGGQGEVWRVRDVQHDRIVALKVRSIGTGDDRDAILREARVLLDLKPHPALPLVREDFFADDSYFLVMDWVEGRTLAEVLASSGPMTLETALTFLRQIGAALDHLHAHEPPIVHQDVKPANVIVRPDGDVVLVDLGISARRGGAAVLAGTPAFRAPELVGASTPTPAVDIYGLAATAVTLLAGEPPRPGARPALAHVPPAQVERVWRALDAGLAYDPARRPTSASAFVASLEIPSTPGNLPRRTASFIGRERDIADVTELLGRSRVVTLVGSGGLGKTRLAFEVASRMAPAYRDGVWLAPLAAVRDPQLVAAEIATIFGLTERRGRSVIEMLRGELSARHVLLVLDNCEHLLDGCRSLIEELTGVDVLATSREAIGASDETVYDVRPLALPPDEAISVKAIVASEAVRLFVERATSVAAAFGVSDGNAGDVVRVCRCVDGLPLAIELAASLVSKLSVSEIAERLDDRFATLRAEPGTEARHTLRGTFEWSYSFLSDAERSAFAAAALFTGGFDAASFADVVGGGASDAASSLAAKSLLTQEGKRYSMLETVRAFALSKLEEQGRTEIRDRFVRWAFDLAQHASTFFDGPDRTAWLATLDREHENLRDAVAFSIEANEARAAPFCVTLGTFWEVRGHWDEGRAFLAAVLDKRTERDTLRADLLAGAGHLAYLEADYEVARTMHGDELSIRLASGDRHGEARALSSLGQIAEARTDFDSARELYGRSLAVYRELDDKKGVAELLSNLGSVAEYIADYELAQSLHEQSLARRREIADDHGAALSLLNLGYVMNYRGDARGREVLEESLATLLAVGDRYGASRAMNLLAIRSWFEGDGAQARKFGEDALKLRRDIGDRLGIAVSLESLAGLEAFRGQGIYAGICFGAADRLREVIGSPVTPSDKPLMDWATSDAKRAVGEEAYDEAYKRGRELALGDAIGFALQRPKS